MVIQMVMLTAALFIMIVSKVPSSTLNSGSVFRAGLMGVVAILGVSWMTATFFDAYQPELIKVFGGIVNDAPMLFGVVVFLFSLVIMSPAATVAAIMPLGVTLGIPAPFLIAIFACTCGDFIIPEQIKSAVLHLIEQVPQRLDALLSTIAIFVRAL